MLGSIRFFSGYENYSDGNKWDQKVIQKREGIGCSWSSGLALEESFWSFIFASCGSHIIYHLLWVCPPTMLEGILSPVQKKNKI